MGFAKTYLGIYTCGISVGDLVSMVKLHPSRYILKVWVREQVRNITRLRSEKKEKQKSRFGFESASFTCGMICWWFWFKPHFETAVSGDSHIRSAMLCCIALSSITECCNESYYIIATSCNLPIPLNHLHIDYGGGGERGMWNSDSFILPPLLLLQLFCNIWNCD